MMAPDMQGEGGRRELLVLDDVCKTYVTAGGVRVEALRGISLTIAAGEFVAIMGQSGSGKSTLMNILGCLDRCSTGRYRVDGRDVGSFRRNELADLRRSFFGFVFQSYNLIATATALENVEIPAVYAGRKTAERHACARTLLTRFGLGDRLAHFPNQLSGGQQQRTAIARAMMNGGRVVLADEPTGSLDSASGRAILDELRQLADSGCAVVVVTHDPEVAARADRTIRLHDGRIVFDPGSVSHAHQVNLASPSPPRGRGARGLRDAVAMAFRSMRANLLRSALTLLGITIGVASVITMLAVGEGSKRSVLKRISALGHDLVTVIPGAPNQRFGEGGAVKSLVLDDAQAIAAVTNVEAVAPMVMSSQTARVGRNDLRTSVIATSPDYPRVRRWEPDSGSFFSADDQLRYRTVAVIGSDVARSLFPDAHPLGAIVLIQNVPFEIIGVMPPRGAAMGSGMDQDNAILIPITTGQLRVFGYRYLQNITAAVANPDRLAEAERAIRELLLARHGTEDFQIRNFSTIIQAVSATQDALKLQLAVIAAISLFVGGIGIMNVMLMNVVERTREIGVRMACGASGADIRNQFLTEAFVISAFGGLLGIACGLLATAVMEWRSTPVAYQLEPVAIAFGCAVIVGIVFGIMPAVKASRLDPVMALGRQ